MLALFIFLSAQNSWSASAGSYIKEGNKLFQEQKYDAAVEKYTEALKKEPNSDIINFNLGTAFYKKGDYQESVSNLQKSLLTDNEARKGKVNYNLGNALYKFGISQENKNLNQAIQSLEQSLGHYEKALQFDPKDKDAQYNYEFVKNELERLKKKQQEQKSQGRSAEPQEQQDESAKENEQQASQPTEQNPQNQNEQAAREEEEVPSQQQKETEETQGQQQRALEESAEQKGAPENEQADPRQLSAKEAERLLQQYEQNEEPKGLLNFFRSKTVERPVVKDW